MSTVDNQEFATLLAEKTAELADGTITEAQFVDAIKPAMDEWIGMAVSDQVLAERVLQVIADIGQQSHNAIAGRINYLPNTQYQARTACAEITAFKTDGTQFTGFSVSAYTTGSNTVVCTVPSTTGLRVGMIGVFTGGAHANLKICAAQIIALTSTTFTVELPRALTGASSAACVFTPIMRGDDVGSASSAPDGWVKTPNLKLWIEDDPAVLAYFPGASRVIGWKKTDAADAVIYVDFNQFNVTPQRVKQFQGKNFVTGHQARIASGTATCAAFMTKDDGTVSVFGPEVTDGWTEITGLMSDTATTLRPGSYIRGASGSHGYIGLAVGFLGTVTGGIRNYTKMPAERIPLRVKYTPNSWYGASWTAPVAEPSAGLLYPARFRLYPETNGVFTSDVSALLIGFDAKQAVAGSALALRDQIPVPHVYGPLFYTQVNDRMMTGSGLWTMYDGGGVIFSNVSGAAFTSLSIDINGIEG